jgi:hypothetical protein
LKKIKIGYEPLSPSLDVPGDRRRVVYWANHRGHFLTTNPTEQIDVLLASENSDFSSPRYANRKVPLVLDLIDAYLSPNGLIEDLSRGIVKRFVGPISQSFKPFSLHVRDFCTLADAVICSSPEQKQEILPYNKNVHVIPDFHEEIPFLRISEKSRFSQSSNRILWEGQPATLGGLKQIRQVIAELCEIHGAELDFVTDLYYFQLLNQYFKGNTSKLISKLLGLDYSHFNLSPWSVKNLEQKGKAARIAIIPIDLTKPLIKLKPENRLLIMWRLGLPCLTSSSPAYERVENDSGVNLTCKTSDEWMDSLDLLLHDEKAAYEHVLRGQQYLEQFHNEKILLDKWDVVFNNLV